MGERDSSVAATEKRELLELFDRTSADGRKFILLAAISAVYADLGHRRCMTDEEALRDLDFHKLETQVPASPQAAGRGPVQEPASSRDRAGKPSRTEALLRLLPGGRA